MFITHDRTFVRQFGDSVSSNSTAVNSARFPATSIATCRKRRVLEIEDRAAAKFDKKLAEGRGLDPQRRAARRTRNEGRVRALQALRKEKADRLDAQGKARFSLDAGASSGKLVVDVRRVSFGYGEQTIIRDLSTRILRGDRVGIIGPNGSERALCSN